MPAASSDQLDNTFRAAAVYARLRMRRTRRRAMGFVLRQVAIDGHQVMTVTLTDVDDRRAVVTTLKPKLG